MTSRRALITGAGGFIGANLVRRLLADGHDVTALVRPGGDPWRLDGVSDSVRVNAVDLCDRDAVDAVFAERRPDWVFHLAARGAYSWQDDRREIVTSNVGALLNVLESSSRCGVGALVNAGSSSEYGFKDHPPGEDEPLEPNSDYAVAKAAGTLLCSHAGRAEALPVTTLRLYSVYGPWEDPRRLVPTVIRRGLRGELPPLVDPQVARDFVYVDDSTDAFVRAAEEAATSPGAVYNVGSGVASTVADVVEIARRVFAIEAEPAWGSMEQRRWDTNVWLANPGRVRARLGWSATVGLEEGFRRTVAWAASRAGTRVL